jgi:signal peptidase I
MSKKLNFSLLKKDSLIKVIIDNIKSLAIALIIALIIRSILIQAFVIPSGSMKPTLLEGDYIFVTKYNYGYSKHSFPLSLPLLSGRIFYSEPKRGDVIVFKYPGDNSTDYIKRLIGLPGDKINESVPNSQYDISTYKETMKFDSQPEKTYNTWRLKSGLYKVDYISPFYVPKDSFFVMGDNRHFSKDSRYLDVGFIPKNNLVGKAQIIFFSINGSFLEFWKWFTEVRFERIFKPIR